MSKLSSYLQKVINGERKSDACDWWLSHIERRCDVFLERVGYDHFALPDNYTDVPPKGCFFSFFFFFLFYFCLFCLFVYFFIYLFVCLFVYLFFLLLFNIFIDRLIFQFYIILFFSPFWEEK